MTIKGFFSNEAVQGIGLGVLALSAIFFGGSYLITRDPLAFIHVAQSNQDSNNPCGEGIHVTHNGQPLANVAVKQLGSDSYTWGATNSTGYMVLSFCSPVGTIITYQATDYGFQLEPHQIIEAKL